MKKTNYASNDMAMRCLNRSVAIINTTFQLLDIYRFCHFIFLSFFGTFYSYYLIINLSLSPSMLIFPTQKTQNKPK